MLSNYSVLVRAQPGPNWTIFIQLDQFVFAINIAQFLLQKIGQSLSELPSSTRIMFILFDVFLPLDLLPFFGVSCHRVENDFSRLAHRYHADGTGSPVLFYEFSMPDCLAEKTLVKFTRFFGFFADDHVICDFHFQTPHD